jgi:arylsulfatase A-like enzyme
LGHWISLYHDEVGIPLIVKYPGENMGRIVDDLVSQIDVAPTVLEVAGIPLSSTFKGQSLRQPVDPDRFLYSEAFMPRAPYGLTRRYRRTQKAVYQHFQKYIEATTGQRELYDMRLDPEEKRDLYNANLLLSASLEQVLKQWAAHQPRHSSVGSTPDEVLKQLKSLGYVQ